MKEKSRKNKRKSEMNAMFFIILLALVMFIISTYAWFSTQKNVSITNLTGTVEVAEGLEISLDADKWSNGLVLGTEDGQLSIIDDAYSGNHNLSPSEMLPVSTLGLVSGSQTDLKMLRGKIENSKELSEIKSMVETDNTPSSSTYPGYFAFDIFLKNNSKTDNDDELQLNYDSLLEILEADKSATGLQNTARVAFALYNGTADVMAEQAEILKQTAGIGVGSSPVSIKNVAIWEPNSNDHVPYIVQNNNKITWSSADAVKYATKQLGNGSKGFDVNNDVNIKSINGYVTYKMAPNGVTTNETDYYNLSQTVTVKSSDVNKIKNASLDIASLMDKGIDIDVRSTSYSYSKLPDLKVQLLNKATTDAKQIASAMLKSTNNHVGKIQSVQMGVFQITPVDSTDVSDMGINDTSTIEKKITAVANVVFQIK